MPEVSTRGRTGTDGAALDRDVLLRGATTYLLANGLTEFGLRPLGRDLGVSARMLVYHFGSRERLIDEVLDGLRSHELELMQQVLESLEDQSSASEMLARVWGQLTRPESLALVRLGAEIAATQAFHPDRFAAWTARQRHEWVSLTRSVVRDRVADTDEIDGVAEMIHVSLLGFVRAFVAGVDVETIERGVEALGRALDAVGGHRTDALPPAPGAVDTSALERWLGDPGPAVRLLGVRRSASGAGRVRLRIEPQPELLVGDHWPDELVRLFADVAVQAGAVALLDGVQVSDVRVDLLGRSTAEPLAADVSMIEGAGVHLIEVTVSGASLVALGRGVVTV